MSGEWFESEYQSTYSGLCEKPGDRITDFVGGDVHDVVVSGLREFDERLGDAAGRLRRRCVEERLSLLERDDGIEATVDQQQRTRHVADSFDRGEAVDQHPAHGEPGVVIGRGVDQRGKGAAEHESPRRGSFRTEVGCQSGRDAAAERLTPDYDA